MGTKIDKFSNFISFAWKKYLAAVPLHRQKKY